MDKSQSIRRQNGLTLVQWGCLLLAFASGLGSTFVLRETFFMPSANAAVVKTVDQSPSK